MKSQVLLVNDKDEVIGYDSIENSHSGRGKHHRAFVTALFDAQNRVLLQKRKHRLFDGLWDLTAISHPLHVNGRDETYQQASDRALKKEVGIGHVEVAKVGAFNYFAKDGKNCENEYCAILTGVYTGKFKPNPKEVYEARWVKYDDFLQDASRSPSKYTPWAQETVKIFKKEKKPSKFLIELEMFSRHFGDYSKKYFARKKLLVKKYPDLIAKFYQVLEDFGSGGKAMRPFLVYLGYRVGGVRPRDSIVSLQHDMKVLPICLAVELLHNFLLIHDDIIDNSDVRRAKPTIHKKLGKIDVHYGVSQAIVIADIAAFEAIQLINQSSLSLKSKAEVLELVTGVILETAYGEILDIEYAHKRPGISKVWLVTELKTAKYSFVGPLKLGALLAGAKKSQLVALEQYGLELGKAFQIQDDILGVFGNEKILGKSTLSDMREGKNTLLFYKAREKTSSAQRRILDKVWGDPRSSKGDLDKVKEIMQNTGALDWCKKQMVDLVRDAKKSVDRISKDKVMHEILIKCADFVIYREK